MNREILYRKGALTCVAILCIGNILVGCQADTDETAGEPTKIQSLAKNSGDAGQADVGIDAREPITGESLAAGVPATPEKGGPRTWEVTGVSTTLNLREQPSTTSRILASYPPGTILDNLGCQRAKARVWCDVQKLGGGPRGYVAAEFLMPVVSPSGSVATGPDD